MTKLVVSEFISLDGVIENPAWTMPYWSEEMAVYKRAELFAAGALLLGRVTYDGFAKAWPGRTDEDGYADWINNMPKYVVSDTLASGSWQNTTILRDDVVERIRAMRRTPGRDLLVFGSGELVQLLLAHNLVDELALQLYPVVLGQGRRLFDEGTTAKLTLAKSQPLASGVIILTYVPALETT